MGAARCCLAVCVLAVWLVALAVPARPAAAEGIPLAPGQVHQGLIVMGGKQIPLPAGSWLVAGLAADEPPADSPGPVGAIRSAVLLAVEEGAVTGFVLAYTNAVSGDGAWGNAPECARDDLHFVEVDYDTGVFRSCAFVLHALGNSGGDPAWAAARAMAEANGWRLPASWLVAGLRQSDVRDVVDVRYYANPERWVAPPAGSEGWADHEWAPGKVTADPVRDGMVRQVIAFARRMREPLAEGMKNRLSRAAPVPMPWTAEAPADDAAESPARDDGLSAFQLAAIKATTFTVFQRISHYGLNVLFLSDPIVAAGLSLTHSIVHPAINFAHEYVFASGGARKTGAGTAATAFAAVGITE